MFLRLEVVPTEEAEVTRCQKKNVLPFAALSQRDVEVGYICAKYDYEFAEMAS